MTVFRFLLISSMVPAISHADLIAHWKFDSTPADEVADFYAIWGGTASYSLLVGAPASSAAADLDGQWLKAGTGIDFERNQPFSVSAWIKGGAQDSTIIGDMSQTEDLKGWELHVGTVENGGNSGSLTVSLNNDYPAIALQVNASAPVLDGQWHHVGFTYNGSSSAAGVKIFVDGIEVATSIGLDALGNSISNGPEAELNIGTRMNGAASTFSGAIDEVALFDNALAEAEMTSIYQNGIESVFFPFVRATMPLAGQSVTEMTSADVTFSLPVGGVDAADLLVNGNPASAVHVVDSKHYLFTFPNPPQGDVHFTWASGHGIVGLNGTAAQPAGWSALFAPNLPAGQAMIAEFLTTNAGGKQDEDHDTPDWIELVNPGTANVDLTGWALTDDVARLRRWTIPSVVLPPGGRKLIFASGKNRGNPALTLHTDFKLAADGGYLALIDPGGNVVHAYDGYPRQEGNVSFGLLAEGKPSDGRAGWRYLSPTPGTAPSVTAYSGAVIGDMAFSPAVPQPGDAITVTIRTSPEAELLAPPSLIYRKMHDAEVTVIFADDGQHGDGAAGDLVWGAFIPAGATTGQMVRWRTSLTSKGVVSRWPINISGGDFLPLYEGTVVGGTPVGQVMPLYQVFVSGYTFPETTSQSGIDSSGGGRGAFYGNGKLYDNVLIRTKGTTSLNLLKRSHRVDFNPGRDFEWSSEFPRQRELNLNAEYVDPSYLRQYHQLKMHRESGGSGAPHFPVKLLMNGITWQLAFHTYPADGELLETMGLDPRGALYKQVGELATSAGEKKTRRWEGTQDYSVLRGGISSGASVANKSLYAFDNLNIPAVINYLAVARLAQESDDVWANMVVYRDSEGTGEWQPIPFDLNLSFGQLFYGFSAPYNTTIQATNDANKSHPLYGSSLCLPNTGNTTQWNRLYDLIIQNPTTRAMLLRRIRSLTDRYLSTSAVTSPLETSFDTMGALIGPEANADRMRWGLPPNGLAYGLGPNISPAQDLLTLKRAFLSMRRTHFYTTHSINNPAKTLGLGNSNKAGIPDAQVAAPEVLFGTIEANPVSGNQNEEYIELTNPGIDAIDVSDWLIRGSAGRFKLKGGTVIPSAGSLYISPDVVSFRARSISPKRNQNRLVVGPYTGRLSPYSETLYLENAAGSLVAQTQVAADLNAPAVHLAITEIMSSSIHMAGTINGDWWELTNTGSSTLDLTGFSWDDSRAFSGQAVFPVFSLNAGESVIILDEDGAAEAAQFRTAWNLPSSVKILTRDDFSLPLGFRGLGNGDSIVVYLPDGSQVVRADYPAHLAGTSRAWFNNGVAVPGGYSLPGKFAAVPSNQSPADLASPGFAAADPSTLADPFEIWSAANDLWSTDANPTADPDGDGRSNRAEYLFGGHPRQFDGASPQTIQPVAGDLEWTVTRRSDDPSLVYLLEASPDLIQWTHIAPPQIAEIPDPAQPGFVQTTYRIVRDDAVKFLRATAK